MDRPVVLVAALFLAGLVLGVTFPLIGGWTAILAAVLCLVTAGGAIHRREVEAGSRWVLIAVMALGVWQGARVETQWRDALASLVPFGEGRVVTVRGTLAREPRLGPSSVRLALAPASLTARGLEASRVTLPIEVQIPGEKDTPIDLDTLALGDTVEAEGLLVLGSGARNPGGFDAQAWQWQRGVAGTVMVTIGDAVEVTPRTPSLWARWLRWTRQLRGRLTERIEHQQGAEAASFSRALLLGDRTELNATDRHAFLLSGLGHLFAVSGLHTALLYGLILGGLRLLRCPWRLSLGLALAALLPYAALVGFQPSVMRAVVMIGALVAGRLLGRSVDMLAALALAALVLCVLDPRAPWQPGFQMSFLAALALVLHAPVIRDILPEEEGGLLTPARRLRRWARRWLLAPAIAIAGVQLAILPIMAEVYHLWSWIAVPMNLLLIPLAALIQLGGALALLLSTLWPGIGDFLGWATAGLVHAMFGAVRLAAGWPGAAVSLTPLPWWAVALWYAILFGGPSVARAVAPDERLRRRARWAIAWAALTAIALWLPLFTWAGPARLRVTFLDVGQGDSTIIEMPAGPVIVVDGGKRTPADQGLLTVEPALRARGISAIDLIVATHADADHIGGLVHLLRRFPVSRVAEGDPRGETATLADFRAATEASGAEHVWLARGAHIRDGLADVRVLNPDPDPTLRPDDTNNNSVVLDVQWREADVLIMGDAEMPAERAMLAAVPDLDCDVLRTGHHGSARGTGAEFLAATTPAVAVISCGRRNPYGHPHPDVLSRLAAAGARTLRTDALGAVTLETDGRTLWITSGGQE